MKRIIALFLCLIMSVSCLASCQNTKMEQITVGAEESTTGAAKEDPKTAPQEKRTEEEMTTKAETKEEPKETVQAPTESFDESHVLHGKKVIFVGNSYTYYGNAVLTKNVSVRKQAQRINDRGYFYQICKSNGANVNVTNWTFGSHGLADLFQNCAADRGCNGVQHKNDLTDRVYDYVFLQERTGEEITPQVLLKNVDTAVAFFREANPDVKIFFLVQKRVYEWDVAWKSALKSLPERGVTVIEWGAMVEDIVTGKTQVPGATQTYDKNSFVICQSADDGYHPNMLAGYITAQMAYCAITGESAVGQEYSFCTDAKIQSAFNLGSYITKYYKYNGAKTNIREIFSSPADMKGLQTLMDQYLAAHHYRNY